MSSLLFHVSPLDPITYIAVTAGVIATVYVACYLPSRRAAINSTATCVLPMKLGPKLVTRQSNSSPRFGFSMRRI
ncbi:MAG: hypothetical protein WAK24_16995 [Candidatus Acidiferrales bacterium]